MKKDVSIIITFLLLFTTFTNTAGCNEKQVDTVSEVPHIRGPQAVSYKENQEISDETSEIVSDEVSEVTSDETSEITSGESENVTESSPAVSEQSDENSAAENIVSKPRIGYVAEEDGNIYYWKYNEDSFEKGGCGGFMQNPDTANEFVCLDPEGNEISLFKSARGNKFYLKDEGVYFETYDSTYHGMLDYFSMSEKIIGPVDENFRIMDMTDDGECVVYSNLSEIISRGKNVSVTLIERGEGDYIALHNGVVYYESGNDDFYNSGGAIKISCVNVDGTNRRDIYIDNDNLYPDSYEYVRHTVGQMYFGDEYIYFSYGGVSGSESFYQGGRIARVKYDGSGAEIIKNDGAGAEFSVNEDGTITEYMDPAPYKGMTDYYREDNNVYSIDRTNGERKLLLSGSDYAMVGIEPPNNTGVFNIYSEADSCYFIDYIEQIGDNVYALVHYGEKDESYSIGYRTGFRRVNSALLKKNLKTGNTEMLYQF